MKKQTLTHIDAKGKATMVDVSEKAVTRRTARAEAVVHLGQEVMRHLRDHDVHTKKGPVFQTAVLAGIMAAKRTSDLIPLCHPLGLDDCQIEVDLRDEEVILTSTTVISARTGVEMEALTAVSVAALTVYDMCKALSHDIVIREIMLVEKTGGKRDFHRS
jgi:cyclic pyranopterin phosphate synthase